MLNALPSNTVISTTILSRNTIEGVPNLDYNNMSLNLRAYVHSFEGANNTQYSRSVGAVALNTSNERGGYYFMSLRTGRKLHNLIWIEFPITSEVITRFKELGKEDKQPLMKNGPIF